MKHVKIKYNPYLVETEITVEGKKPKTNSALNFGKKRLQEWIDKFPQILFDEYRDSNFTIDYIGIVSDFEDLEHSFKNFGDKLSVTCTFHKTADISDVE